MKSPIHPVTRRQLLGASLGVGGGLLTRGVSASPARPAAPMIRRRNADTVKLSLWGQFPEESDAFKAIVSDFQKTNPNVQIDVSMTPSDQWKAKINASLNSGSGPDIWMANSKPQMDIDVK